MFCAAAVDARSAGASVRSSVPCTMRAWALVLVCVSATVCLLPQVPGPRQEGFGKASGHCAAEHAGPQLVEQLAG